MGEQKHTISLNGRIYDVTTGALLRDESGSLPPKPKVHQLPGRGRTIDGFMPRAKATAKTKTVAPKPVKHRSKPKAAPAHTAHAMHQSTQRSKTLMRSAVKRPAVSPILLNPSEHVAPTPTDPRLARALNVPKSEAISRFQTALPDPVVKRTASIPVRPTPAHSRQASVEHVASVSTSVSKESTFDNLFANALTEAHSHEAPAVHKPKLRKRVARRLGTSSRRLTISAAVVAVMVLGGFFAIQNAPNISLKLASARADVHGKLPGYKPSGFALSGPIRYQPGVISISFHSNSDDRAFHITEQSSSWNSESLLDNYVAVNQRPYQTYQDNGRTIYVYNDADASWVDGGIWYRIEGNSNLSTDQLRQIANSI